MRTVVKIVCSPAPWRFLCDDALQARSDAASSLGVVVIDGHDPESVHKLLSLRVDELACLKSTRHHQERILNRTKRQHQ